MILIAVVLSVALMAAPVLAEERRTLGAHVHGQGHLDIAILGETVRIVFSAPGADVVGFEHGAKSDADHKAIREALAVLARPLEIFGFPPASGCTVAQSDVAVLDGAHGAHSEFRARYTLRCVDTASVDRMSFGYFTAFPRAQELQVHMISDAGVAAFDVSRATPELDLAGRM